MNDYFFDLPDKLIARHPSEVRSESKLLRVNGNKLTDNLFNQLPDMLSSGDLLVINNTKVFPARLMLKSPNGGNVELLLVRQNDSDTWLAMAKPARRMRPGVLLSDSCGNTIVEVVERVDQYLSIRDINSDLLSYAKKNGSMPLPPYIRKARNNDGVPKDLPEDNNRYQTVYANQSGSVAAPTAGLHFDDDLMKTMCDSGVDVAEVTLHIGPGTFVQPSQQDIKEKRLHSEQFEMSADVWKKIEKTRLSGGKVIAVGTTTLRVLETVNRLQLHSKNERFYSYSSDTESRPEFVGNAEFVDEGWQIKGATQLFVAPPDQVAVADGLITNFHLPDSSLLMLVSAFLGKSCWRTIYRHAIKHKYRFYSYGDAMLIMGDKT